MDLLVSALVKPCSHPPDDSGDGGRSDGQEFGGREIVDYLRLLG